MDDWMEEDHPDGSTGAGRARQWNEEGHSENANEIIGTTYTSPA